MEYMSLPGRPCGALAAIAVTPGNMGAFIKDFETELDKSKLRAQSMVAVCEYLISFIYSD